jgi:hypothetical protein
MRREAGNTEKDRRKEYNLKICLVFYLKEKSVKILISQIN